MYQLRCQWVNETWEIYLNIGPDPIIFFLFYNLRMRICKLGVSRRIKIILLHDLFFRTLLRVLYRVWVNSIPSFVSTRDRFFFYPSFLFKIPWIISPKSRIKHHCMHLLRNCDKKNVKKEILCIFIESLREETGWKFVQFQSFLSAATSQYNWTHSYINIVMMQHKIEQQE